MMSLIYYSVNLTHYVTTILRFARTLLEYRLTSVYSQNKATPPLVEKFKVLEAGHIHLSMVMTSTQLVQEDSLNRPLLNYAHGVNGKHKKTKLKHMQPCCVRSTFVSRLYPNPCDTLSTVA